MKKMVQLSKLLILILSISMISACRPVETERSASKVVIVKVMKSDQGIL